MKIQSKWLFHCNPESIWPHFFNAKMDESMPVGFRIGVPRPISCRVLGGAPAIGKIRQCKTSQGGINQEIIVCDKNRKLVYEMRGGSVQHLDWISYLSDTFELLPVKSGVVWLIRTTRVDTQGFLSEFKKIAVWYSLKLAHRYAAKNWRRLSVGG